MAINTVSVTIDLATTPATQAGFGTQLFVSTNKFFNERVRVFNSLEDAEDLPSNSDEYKAISMHFNQSPSLPIKIGRRDTTQVQLTPISVDEGDVFSFTITVNDGDDLDVTYTAGAAETATDVATAIVSQIQGNAAVAAHVTATDNTGSLTIVEDSASDFFYISNASSNFTYTATSSETPADVLDAVELADPDYYGITFNETNDATVLLMAAQAEARNKLFLYCTADTAVLTAWNKTDSGVDVLADLNLVSRRQSVGIFHHEAQDTFPEVGVFAYFAGRGYQPGTITWNWKTISGVGPAQNPTSGEVLTATEIGYVKSRNANTFEREAVGTIFGPGSVAKGTGSGTGEWIEHVTSKDFLTARITEAYKTKFYNLNKISYSSVGINSQKSTLATVLNRYVETETTPNILDIDRPYELIFPQSTDVSFADKASQTLPVSFKAYLSGTQTSIVVQGTLTFNASV
jgi:hypothetical protein